MSRISRETIDAVASSTDMVSLVGEYVRLEQRGSDWWGCCPFHGEKTPSFHVIPEKKAFYCFGCGKGGGVFNFLMEMEKLSFPQAVEFLAKKNGIEIHYEAGFEPDSQEKQDNTKELLLELYKRVAVSFKYILHEKDEGKKALEYLKERGVSDEMVETFSLGFSPRDRYWLFKFLRKKGYSSEFLEKSGLFSKKYPNVAFFSGRLMFPIQDRRGNVIAFGGRIIDEGDGKNPKYLNSGEMIQYRKGETLFAFHLAINGIREKKAVILCEGYMDVIAYHQAGINIAVAPLGTAFTLEQIKLLRPFAGTILLSFDSDGAGQKATYKSILMCRTLDFEVKIIRLTQGKDPSEVLNNFGPESLKNCVESAIIDFDYLLDRGGSMYSCDTVQGKADLCRFIFPYVQALPSSVQKETALEKLSLGISVSYQALYQDFLKFIKGGGNPRLNSSAVTDGGNVRKKSGNPGITAELRGLLVVAVNLSYYEKLRSLLSPDDFEDDNARELFIAMEECYREDTLSYNSLLNHCKKQEVTDALVLAAAGGEFSNPDLIPKIIDDVVNLVKKNSLKKQRGKLLQKIKKLNTGNENTKAIEDLMAEIKNIDFQLKARERE